MLRGCVGLAWSVPQAPPDESDEEGVKAFAEFEKKIGVRVLLGIHISYGGPHGRDPKGAGFTSASRCWYCSTSASRFESKLCSSG